MNCEYSMSSRADCRHRSLRSRGLALIAFAVLALASVRPAIAQRSSLYHHDLPGDERQVLRLSNSSFLYQKLEPPPELKLNDLITVIVDEKSQLISEGEVNRRKNARYDAQLKSWLELDGLDVRPAEQPNGDPRANGTLDNQYQATSELETRDSLKFRVAARIVDVRPNGNLVLEAHRTIRNNEEVWEQSLTGVIRREDVLPNNTVLSEDIAELSVNKREIGGVRDGYRRGWLSRLYDRFSPF